MGTAVAAVCAAGMSIWRSITTITPESSGISSAESSSLGSSASMTGRSTRAALRRARHCRSSVHAAAHLASSQLNHIHRARRTSASSKALGRAAGRVRWPWPVWRGRDWRLISTPQTMCRAQRFKLGCMCLEETSGAPTACIQRCQHPAQTPGQQRRSPPEYRPDRRAGRLPIQGIECATCGMTDQRGGPLFGPPVEGVTLTRGVDARRLNGRRSAGTGPAPSRQTSRPRQCLPA